MPIRPKVLIADSSELLTKNMAKSLASFQDFDIHTCVNAQIAFSLFLEHQPDISILSTDLPESLGLDLISKFRGEQIESKIILNTLYEIPDLFQKTEHLAISGYLFKQFALVELKNCISKILLGDTYISEDLRKFFKLPTEKPQFLSSLTPSEKTILQLIATNNTTPQIAELLFISKKTVEKHRSNISKKLNLSGKTNSLLLWAKENVKHLRLTYQEPKDGNQRHAE